MYFKSGCVFRPILIFIITTAIHLKRVYGLKSYLTFGEKDPPGTSWHSFAEIK